MCSANVRMCVRACVREWVEGNWIGYESGERCTYVSWTDDSTIPVRHEDIVAVLEAIGTRSVADALLSFFELLEQPEVAWDCGRNNPKMRNQTTGKIYGM